MKVESSYLICSAPRCGSNLLCDLLKSTGVAGEPAEFFDYDENNRRVWKDLYDIEDDAEYLKTILDKRTTSNGVFGAKVHWFQLRTLADQIEQGDELSEPRPDFLARVLPKLRFIWMKRRDKIAQGISYYIAFSTGQWWHRHTGATAENQPQPEYNFDQIRAYIASVEELEAEWGAYFRRHHVEPVTLYYEDLVREPQRVVQSVLEFLAVSPGRVTVSAPGFVRPLDETYRVWTNRYTEDLVTASLPLPSQPASADDRNVDSIWQPSLRPEAERAASDSGPSDDEPAETLTLTAYCINPRAVLPIEVAPRERVWMEATDRGFANRCLPLLIANQAGWMILSRHKVAITWGGDQKPSSLRIEYLSGGDPRPAVSHFGSGILTWNLPYVFRTPPGCNLLFRGPANAPKDGIYPLEGMVETDWSETTPTMNWVMTRPNHTVTFEEGEPICMIVPQPRGDLEVYRPEVKDIAADRELNKRFLAWVDARTRFSRELKIPGSPAAQQGWQRHYFQGVGAGDAELGSSARGWLIDHQTDLKLSAFVVPENHPLAHVRAALRKSKPG